MTYRILLSALGIFIFGSTWAAEVEPDNAAGAQLRVAAVQGSATLSLPGQPDRRLKVGDALGRSAVITTGRAGAVDLFLGNSGGTIRLTQSTTLSVSEFNVNPQGVLTNLQVHLRAGSILGLGNQLPSTSRYQVQVSNGFIDILARQYRISSNGFLVAMDGLLVFAHIPKGGEPTLVEVKAPPAVYFFPGEGVQPAPPELQQEVTAQVQARLR